MHAGLSAFLEGRPFPDDVADPVAVFERWALSLEVWATFEEMFKQRYPRRRLDPVRSAYFDREAKGRSRNFAFFGSDWKNAAAVRASEAARGGTIWRASWTAHLARPDSDIQFDSRLSIGFMDVQDPLVRVTWRLDAGVLLDEWGDRVFDGMWQALSSLASLFPLASARVGLADCDALDMEWMTGPYPRTSETIGIVAGYRSMVFLPMSAVEVLGGLGAVLESAPVAEIRAVERDRDVVGVVARLVDSVSDLSEERLRAWRAFLEPVAVMPTVDHAPPGFLPQSRPLDVLQQDWPIPLRPPERHLRIVT